MIIERTEGIENLAYAKEGDTITGIFFITPEQIVYVKELNAFSIRLKDGSVLYPDMIYTKLRDKS